ncbi:MAG: T9SS type A sorting domain-containing protein [Bacteroidia bacterium]
MKKLSILLLLHLLPQLLFAQTQDWRVGFEYNETDPGFWGITEQTHDSIQQNLALVTRAQTLRGGININSIGGGWDGMQSASGAPIDFSQTDAWVQRLQRNGFELVWNLEPNAPWSFSNNPDCITPPGLQIPECAPDFNHWNDWYSYVRSIVERYDGDGDSDMTGLTKPVRFYIMEQEIYYSGAANNIAGDSGEAAGYGYWEDNVQNLIRLHEVTYQAIHDADPSGQTKLVGSGALLFDLYGDFPDYPNTNGATTISRINGNNLMHASYAHGWDSLAQMLTLLGTDTPFKKCDYIGWHPHINWKSTDQCMRLIHEYAPGKPIFIDDMWSNILTSIFPHNGFTQFIGGDSLEGDFPNSTVVSYNALYNGLENHDSTVINWYNAKGARDAVKCFALVFGEGAERAEFSLSNDPNPHNVLLYPFSYPYRYTGMMGKVNEAYTPKPVLYTMQLLVDKIHDFTSVSRVNVSSNPYTRVYKFERQRGTSCYVAWSESNRHPNDPHIPNGETVSIPVISDSLLLTSIITQPGLTLADSVFVQTSGSSFSIQLGFEPVILEETQSTSGIAELKNGSLKIYPNPANKIIHIELPGSEIFHHANVSLYDATGRICYSIQNQNGKTIFINTSSFARGAYRIVVEFAGKLQTGRVVVE